MSFEFTKDDMSDLKTILNMSNIKIKYEEIKQDFYYFIKNIMYNYPLLYSGFCKECVTSVKTKNHGETYGVHLLATGKIAEYFGGIFYDTNNNILSEIISKEDFKILCMETGFLHDIGKPFVRHEMKKRPMYIGHSQVGSCILNYILTNKYKHEMEWVINNHMCNCTHMRPIDSIKKIGPHMIISLSVETNHILAFALLSVLSYADQLGRLSVDKIDSELASIHSNNLFNKLLEEDMKLNLNNLNFNGKIICILFGLAGSSKTFICNKIISTFSDKYDIVHIERDASLYKVYEKHIGSTVDKKYIDIYQSIYDKNNSEISKHVVQKQWEQDLEDGLTTPITKEGQIILIDSVQPLYQYQWRLTIDSLKKHSKEAYAIYCNTTKIGYYGIPVHLIDISKETKIGKLSFLPNNSKDLFYPSVETETGNNSFISYGMGTFVQLNSYIKKYLEFQKNKLSVLEIELVQENLEVILNKIADDFNLTELQDIYIKFIKLYLLKSGGNINFIKYKIEYEYNNIQMVTFLYDNGFETFNGITRDYRGEGFLFCKTTYPKFTCIRPSLQVLPEMMNIYKDKKTFPYIFPIWDQIKCLENNLYSKENIKEKIPLQIYLTSKYDGFMFNMTFIPDTVEVYKKIIELINGVKEENDDISQSFYKHKNGIFLFGSKRKILVKNTCVHNSILGSYNSIEEFLDISYEYIYKMKEEYSITTLHFESIDNIQDPELTVYYEKSSCTFIGSSIFNQKSHKKSFKLPLEYTKFKSVCNIIDCKNKWSNVIDVYNLNYKKLLKGDLDVEPEGYVIHILIKNEKNDIDWIHIKYKYDIYYAVYKSNSKHNKELFLQLSSNNKYKILRQRFIKFKDKPSVENLLNNNIDKIKSIKDIIYDKTYNNFIDNNIIKKEWVIFWSKNKQLFFNIFNELKIILSEYYISFKDIIIEKEIIIFIIKIYEYTETKNILLNLKNQDIINILIKYIFV